MSMAGVLRKLLNVPMPSGFPLSSHSSGSAMATVPRHEFVPVEIRPYAYADQPLPIGWNKTISQPFIAAVMADLLEPRPGDSVLEIGTGSGYCAAVLSLLAREVHTVERIESLHKTAKKRLKQLGYRNVRCHSGDGTLGLPREAPFDAIVVAAGTKDLPKAYPEQLAEGGRLLIPIGPPSRQQMVRIMRLGGKLQHEVLGNFGFVPLVSDAN